MGEQFALASPTPNFGGLNRPIAPVIYAHVQKWALDVNDSVFCGSIQSNYSTSIILAVDTFPIITIATFVQKLLENFRSCPSRSAYQTLIALLSACRRRPYSTFLVNKNDALCNVGVRALSWLLTRSLQPARKSALLAMIIVRLYYSSKCS